MLKWANPFKRQPIMEFYCHPNDYGIYPEPKPAGKYIPDWYKRIPQVINDGRDDRDQHGAHIFTAKKCLPMLDCMTMGYIIPLYAELSVRSNHDCSTIEVVSSPNTNVCDFHDIRQLGERSAPGFPAPPLKFINPWVVKTAPGWSTYFTAPVNAMNPHFTCLSGLVDTDKYPKQVNFPAIWHTPNFDGTLEAGTPLVVAIPVKRDTLWKKYNVRPMTNKEGELIHKIGRMQEGRKKVYTSELREERK